MKVVWADVEPSTYMHVIGGHLEGQQPLNGYPAEL